MQIGRKEDKEQPIGLVPCSVPHLATFVLTFGSDMTTSGLYPAHSTYLHSTTDQDSTGSLSRLLLTRPPSLTQTNISHHLVQPSVYIFILHPPKLQNSLNRNCKSQGL
jgi:hypothetical protein